MKGKKTGQKKLNKKQVAQVKRIMDADEETKNLVEVNAYGQHAAETSYDGYFYDLQEIVQGVNINERIGNVIEPKKIQIKGHVTMASDAANNRTKFRYAVVRIKQQPTSTVPATNTVLAGVGAATVTESLWNSAGLSNKEFDILVDKSFELDLVGNGSHKSFNITLGKKLDRLIHYNGAAATNVGKGTLQLLIMSDQPTATSPALNISHQIWYKDA